MIGRRYIDADKLLGKIHFQPNSALGKWLKRQPRTLALVSRKGAAAIVGYRSEHLGRLGDRLPKPIEVEGGTPVYFKHEMEALAKELEAEKQSKEEASS